MCGARMGSNRRSDLSLQVDILVKKAIREIETERVKKSPYEKGDESFDKLKLFLVVNNPNVRWANE